MKITKRRLKQIIAEELEGRQIDPDLRLTDEQGPFVLRRSGAGQHEEYFRILQRKGQTLLPAWSAIEDAFKYQTADKAMDGKYRVEEHGNIPVQIIPREEWSADEMPALNETRPRHGIDPREVSQGKAFVHLLDGTSGRVVFVTRDVIHLQDGRRVLPAQIDWRKTTGSKRKG